MLAASFVAACGSDEPDTRRFPDVGRFSVISNDDQHVTFSLSVGPPDRCLTSCDINSASCRATLTGTRIELRSLLEVRNRPGLVECPADCGWITATCELEVPGPGTYQFGFASRFDTAMLPLAESTALFEGE